MPPHPRRHRPWTAALVEERPRPERIRTRAGGWRLAVATVCFGAFMGQLDASIVTLAYGGLRSEFHASLAAVEWVSLAYLLTLVALLVPVGRLSDAHGRKLFYLYGFLVFTLASAACALAPSLGVLVGFRVLQAAGAAMLQANSVALVTTSAPRGKMRAALGVQAAAQALGLALGPTVGGALVAGLGWRWVFAVNVPVGVAALVAGQYLLPRTRTRSPVAGADRLGPVLLAVSTTSLLLGLSMLSGLSVPVWAVAVLFALAAAAAAGFALRERRAARPLVDPALLRRRAVATGLAAALGAYLVLFGPLVLVPVVLTGAGSSELHAGLVLTALPAGFALAATCADRVLPVALGDRARCLLGAAVAAGALAAMLALPLTAAPLVPLLALLGLGLGTFTPANNALVMGAVPASASGTGGGLVNMVRGLGTALGIALVTLALHLSGEAGPHRAVAVLLGVALLVVAAAALGPPTRRNSSRTSPGRPARGAGR
ncbi:MFS transporter [Streptomyces roseoverticillatus]|uniref:MFS transporter n=1 Tax=Streptomyces roseoverticillatus TaxID=66429 RepID=UPI00340EE3C5